MKTKNVVKAMFAVCLLACYSCGDKLTVEVPVSSMTIELEDILVGDGSKSTLSPFSATETVLLSAIQGISDEAMEYRSKIESIEVGATSSISIIATDSVGTLVEEFLLSANDVGDFTIPQYNLGMLYSDNIHDFASKVLTKLFVSEEVTLTASGKTDIPSGKKLKVKIMLEDIRLITNVLKQ